MISMPFIHLSCM